jgi:hypothetical protein
MVLSIHCHALIMLAIAFAGAGYGHERQRGEALCFSCSASRFGLDLSAIEVREVQRLTGIPPETQEDRVRKIFWMIVADNLYSDALTACAG